MAAYSFSQLEQLWTGAGGNRAMAPTMAAIALAESSGNPNAQNPSGASGLWQIMLPTNAADVPGGAGNVFNPQANAAAAVKIANSQGLGAWTTYTSGAYKQFLSGGSSGGGGVLGAIESALGSNPATSAVGSGLSNIAGGVSDLSSIPGAISSVGSEIGNVGSAIGSVGSNVGGFFSLITTPSTWFTVLKFVAGAVLVFMALKALTGVETPSMPAVVPV